jgi:fructose-1,6-bisphosphatase/inositol monophosphatase family enzyme
MKTDTIAIVDRGRGPQLSSTRITVLDVFYYLHRGHDFDVIHKAMPTLSRQEFDVVVEYVKSHHDELVEKDRKAEEFIRNGIAAQRARGGIFAEADEGLTAEQHVARLKELMSKRAAEKNGARHSG